MSTRGYVGFIHRGKVQGWFNHWDSYPTALGRVVVTFFQKYTQEELRTLFLKRIKWVKDGTEDDTPLQKNSEGMLNVDWTKPVRAVKDSEFYKDPIFCEYTYIFNLDSKEKELLLFKGFGTRPSKGYESWCQKSRAEEKVYYNNYCGKILEYTKDPIEMVKYIMNSEARKVLRTPQKNLPILIGLYHKDSMANELLEKRIREGADSGFKLVQ